MPDYPSVSTTESTSTPPAIVNAAQTIGAMVGRTRRGPLTPTRVGNATSWARIYGGYDDNGYSYEAVQQFFELAEGAALYFCRVVGTGGSGSNVNASCTLQSTGAATSGAISSNVGAFPARLANGDTFLGKVDGGGAVTVTITATAASKTGAAATYAAVTASHVLVVVDPAGVQRTVTFAGTENSQALFHDAINSQLIGFSAINVAGQTKLQTDKKGTGATASVHASTSADVLTSLGLTASAFTAGTGNVADVDAVTATEFAGLAAAYTGSTATHSATSVTITSNTSGASSSFQFSSGTGVSKIAGFDNTVHSGSPSAVQDAMVFTAVGPGSDDNTLSVLTENSDSVIGSLSGSVAAGTYTSINVSSSTAAKVFIGDCLKFTDATTSQTVYAVVKQITGNKLTFVSSVVLTGGGLTLTNTQVVNLTFSVTIYDGVNVVQGPYTDLRQSPLSKRKYFVTVINKGEDAARVTVADSSPTFNYLRDNRPVNVTVTGDNLTGGSEDTSFTDADYIGSSIDKTSFYALTPYMMDISWLAFTGCPDPDGDIHKAAQTWCETNMVILMAGTNYGADITAVETFANKIGTSSWKMGFTQWIRRVDPQSDVNRFFPPAAHGMGLWARTTLRKGIQKPAFGDDDGRLVNTNGLERVWEGDEKSRLVAIGWCYFENVPGLGQVCMLGRTTEKGTAFTQAHARRIFQYSRKSLIPGLRPFLSMDPTASETQSAARRLVDGFFSSNRRMLAGKTESDAWQVICDASNNTGATAKAFKLKIKAFLNVPDVTERVEVDLSPLE